MGFDICKFSKIVIPEKVRWLISQVVRVMRDYDYNYIWFQYDIKGCDSVIIYVYDMVHDNWIGDYSKNDDKFVKNCVEVYTDDIPVEYVRILEKFVANDWYQYIGRNILAHEKKGSLNYLWEIYFSDDSPDEYDLYSDGDCDVSPMCSGDDCLIDDVVVQGDRKDIKRNVDITCRTWCMTLNNYSTEHNKFYENLVNDKTVDYFICGKEMGKQNNTPHLQMFIRFKNSKKFSVVHKKYGFGKAHIEKSRASDYKASEYCKKEGNFFEIGNRPVQKNPTQGKRSDLDEMYQMVKARASLVEIMDKYPSQCTRYINNINRMRGLVMQQRTKTPKVYWFWGESGAGKTYLAERISDGKNGHFMKGNDKWWDGYDQQEVVIFDEFNGWMDIRTMNQLISHLPFQVEVKGGYIPFNSPIIIFTSDRPPSKIYAKSSQRLFKQLFRRVKDSIVYVSSNYQEYSDYDSDDDNCVENGMFAKSSDVVNIEYGVSMDKFVDKLAKDHGGYFVDKKEEIKNRYKGFSKDELMEMMCDMKSAFDEL